VLKFKEIKINAPNDFLLVSKFFIKAIMCNCKCSIFDVVITRILRCCVTNRKIAGSKPAGVSGIFIDIKSFRSH